MQQQKGKNTEYRYHKNQMSSLENWTGSESKWQGRYKANCHIDCGWGRLFFGQTFEGTKTLAKDLVKEKTGTRDIAFYVKDPQVLISHDPTYFFIDPSVTYRMWFEKYRPAKRVHKNINIRRATLDSDFEMLNHILRARKMVEIDPEFLNKHKHSKELILLVAESVTDQKIVGFVMGVDHSQVFNDPENGSSLWSLAVDPHCQVSGVGESLTRYLIEYFQMQGRSYMDLSVMHDNQQAIKLYKKLHFVKVPVFTVKMKNVINKKLYSNSNEAEAYNPYAQIIINEAVKRGLRVEDFDVKQGCFYIYSGQRKIRCRESLTDLTSAYSNMLCDNKNMTRKVLNQFHLQTPQVCSSLNSEALLDFLTKHKQVVVKPLSGEQGKDVYVGIEDFERLNQVVTLLVDKYSEDQVVVENKVNGEDVRIIVINYKFVAAAVRRPPQVVGTGEHTLRQLIEKQSRRRQAATGGESSIPLDEELISCLKEQGYTLDSILEAKKKIVVRKACNLHQGGTIEDITQVIDEKVKQVSEVAAKALEIPVVGFDLMMPDLSGSEYNIIEANERPGLANHEPQPVVESFIDFLFPETVQKTAF